jgi:heme/copper-type cytochrome/quinol oxidase subunit 2
VIPHSLSLFIFWLAAVSALVAHVAILRSILRVRRAPDRQAAAAPSAREILWAVLPAIALAIVLVVTWSHVVS